MTTSVSDKERRVTIDFNRAVNFPFAFSDFGTCPARPGRGQPAADRGDGRREVAAVKFCKCSPLSTTAPTRSRGSSSAATSQIRLLTTVTVLSLLDPVRVAEDYATLDQLSGGRLDIIIGKGNDPDQNALFGYDLDGQWDRNREKYGLLRRLLREESV